MNKRMWFIVWALLLLPAALLLAVQLPVFAEPEAEEWENAPEPVLSCEACLLVMRSSGQVLYAKDADKKMYPASTTKIMTAMIVLERVKNLDDIVTVDEESPFIEGSKIFIDVGELLSVRDLLHAMLIESANDAAGALAIYVAGSYEAFADLMNEKAAALGCKNTNFVNPHGLHDENHYTTAEDLYVIAKAAMDNPIFAEIVGKASYSIAPTNKQPETRHLYNTNALLSGAYGSYEIIENSYGEAVETRYPYATGIKTGYTDEAGRCLVSSATDGVNTIYAIVLKADPELVFQDSVRLLDYGLFGFQSYELIKMDQVVLTHELRDSQNTKIELVPKTPLVSMLKRPPVEGEIHFQTEIKKNLSLPIRAGEPIGTVEAFLGEQSLGRVELASNADISGRPLLDEQLNKADRGLRINFWKIALILGEILIAFVLITFAAYFLGFHPNSGKR